MVPTKVVFGFTCTYQNGEFCDSDETTSSRWVSKEKVLEYIKVPDFIEKYKAYMNFDGNIQYLECITKPQWQLKLNCLI